MSKILDNWFLKNENCTYKEFCEIYNGEKPVTTNLSFIEFPKDILKLMKDLYSEQKYPKYFKDFLEKEGILELFELRLEESREVKKVKAIKEYLKGHSNDPTNHSYYCFISYGLDFENTPEGFIYWNEINTKWIKYYKDYIKTL